MKAKVKVTGEIVEVCFSPTNCMEVGGKRWWNTYELDFKVDAQPLPNSNDERPTEENPKTHN